LNFLDVTIINK